MIVVVMGVSGSGKTTIGTRLAEALQCHFLEGDSLHPAVNVEKMSHGIPLTDADRAPWLAAIRAHILAAIEHGQCLVVACSALKQQYRDFLSGGTNINWVYLKGTEELIASRIQHRPEHYMKAGMLPSQFADLEEPHDALVMDISLAPDVILQQLLPQLRARS
ncbi:MAG TPA: gluconokinase [Terriglobales bacterium]|jgi:gluconokinase|nr:gluconokinase [Terriglobales bacterium]